MTFAEYEFHIYDAPDGDVSTDPREVVKLACFDEAAAKSAARKMAKREPGPIDVARCGPSPWNHRYIGTASPKYPGSTICRQTVFERLD